MPVRVASRKITGLLVLVAIVFALSLWWSINRRNETQDGYGPQLAGRVVALSPIHEKDCFLWICTEYKNASIQLTMLDGQTYTYESVVDPGLKDGQGVRGWLWHGNKNEAAFDGQLSDDGGSQGEPWVSWWLVLLLPLITTSIYVVLALMLLRLLRKKRLHASQDRGELAKA